MKIYISLLAILAIVLSTVAFKPENHRRPLELLNKKPNEFLNLNNIANKIKIVHYLVENDDKYQIEDIPVKNLNIEYKSSKKWHAKSLFNNDYNVTGCESNRNFQVFLFNVCSN